MRHAVLACAILRHWRRLNRLKESTNEISDVVAAMEEFLRFEGTSFLSLALKYVLLPVPCALLVGPIVIALFSREDCEVQV